MKTDIVLSSLADKCRKHFGEDGTSPIDVFTMVSDNPNLAIVFYPFSDKISGMCVKSENSVIAISSSMTYGRQRFTVAHELYHLFYDADNPLVICVKSLTSPDRKENEKEADVFASFLLAPYTSLESFIEKNKLNIATDPSATVKIEQYFQMSRQATMIRLKKQGYTYTPSVEDKLTTNISSYASRLGYDVKLYRPYGDDKKKYFTVGAYLEQAEHLRNDKKITTGKYEEYLIDAFRSDLLSNNAEGELYD
jgi:Zn-dependent peptidase ImmA (M78 family)